MKQRKMYFVAKYLDNLTIALDGPYDIDYAREIAQNLAEAGDVDVWVEDEYGDVIYRPDQY